MTQQISDAEFDDIVRNNPVVMVDFWAEWCGPCQMLGPVIDQLSEELEGKVKIVKMNVDENKGVPGKFGIMSIPTLLVFKDGNMVDRMVGVLPKDMISEHLQKFMD